MTEIIFLLAAVIPVVVWGIYIYRKDRIEKEPLRMLLLSIILGGIIIIPVAFMESIIREEIYRFFKECTLFEDIQVISSSKYYWLYKLTDNMIGIALIEEGWKWAAMWVVTHKNHNFNSSFDGIIYAVYVSIGFAATENIQYVFAYGLPTALARMGTAIPAHMFFAILMGSYYSKWFAEKRMIKNLVLGILFPVLTHGLYDYFCIYQKVWSKVTFWVFLLILYLYCFYLTRRMSKEDHLIK